MAGTTDQSSTRSTPLAITVPVSIYDTDGESVYVRLTLSHDDDDADRGRQLDCRLVDHEEETVREAILTVDLAALKRALNYLDMDANARAPGPFDGDG